MPVLIKLLIVAGAVALAVGSIWLIVMSNSDFGA